MVPTDDAMITRQMLYSARPFPAPCATLAISPPPQSDHAARPISNRSPNRRVDSTRFPSTQWQIRLMQQNQLMWRRTPSSVQAWAQPRAPRPNSLPPTDHPNPATPKNKKRPARDAPNLTPKNSSPGTPPRHPRQFRQRRHRLRFRHLALRQRRPALERFHQHLNRQVRIRTNKNCRRQRPIPHPRLPGLRHPIAARDRNLEPPRPLSLGDFAEC